MVRAFAALLHIKYSVAIIRHIAFTLLSVSSGSSHCQLHSFSSLIQHCCVSRMAPEVLMGNQCSFSADIFSYGESYVEQLACWACSPPCTHADQGAMAVQGSCYGRLQHR